MEGSKQSFNDRIESWFNMICMILVALYQSQIFNEFQNKTV